MNEHDVTRRLRDIGDQPVPDATHDAHLQRMSAVGTTTPIGREKRFGRLAVAAAALVGFFAGSTGLAMAGALPAPAQGVAHEVLAVVDVHVPDRKDNHGACVSTAAKANPDDEVDRKAAIDDCKETHPPGRSGDAPGRSGDAPGRSGTAGAKDHPCRGKPPWAGGGLTDQERADARQQHQPECPGRGLDDADEDQAG